MTENVNKFAVSDMTTFTERDFKSEYLFRTCSIATTQVTSLEFNPIRCAFMLCNFDQTRRSYLAISFILRGSTAKSSARSDYIAVPERFGQNEEPAGRNKERTKKKFLFPKVDLIDALIHQTSNHDFCVILCMLFYLILMNLYYFPIRENPFDLSFMSFIVSARE